MNYVSPGADLISRRAGDLIRSGNSLEETRELRLMGGYTPGAEPALGKAIRSAPRIYEAMRQAPDAPRSEDPFIELAAALRSDPKG